jgi:hypothetical protein
MRNQNKLCILTLLMGSLVAHCASIPNHFNTEIATLTLGPGGLTESTISIPDIHYLDTRGEQPGGLEFDVESEAIQFVRVKHINWEDGRASIQIIPCGLLTDKPATIHVIAYYVGPDREILRIIDELRPRSRSKN